MAEFTAGVADTLTRLAEFRYTVDEATHTVGLGTLLVRTAEGEFAFVHQSVMEGLVANSTAESLRNGHVAATLLTRKMSTLIRDFLCDLAGHEVARSWGGGRAGRPGGIPGGETERIGRHPTARPGADQVLVRVDLRGVDLTECDLRNADLRGLT